MRLLIAISGFVMAGLIAAGAVTYVLIRNYLLARVDERLRGAQLAMFHQLQDASASFEPVPGATDLMPVGTVGEIVRGADVVAGPVFAYGKRVGPPPSIPALSNLEEPRIFTTGAIGRSSFRYRALAQGLVPSGAVFVVAIPLTEVGQTLHRLLGVGLAVTVSVLLGLGGLSWWIVRRELRPLERIEETAGAIAAGDLSQRVGFTDPRT